MIYEKNDIVRYDNKNCIVEEQLNEFDVRIVYLSKLVDTKNLTNIKNEHGFLRTVNIKDLKLILKNNTKCPKCGKVYDLHSVDKDNCEKIICQWCD